MGLTRRKDNYVELRVLDDGKHLRLAPSGMGKLKRWKCGSRNLRQAKDQEAAIQTRLLGGQMLSPILERVRFRNGRAPISLLEEVLSLATYEDRKVGPVSHDYLWRVP